MVKGAYFFLFSTFFFKNLAVISSVLRLTRFLSDTAIPIIKCFSPVPQNTAVIVYYGTIIFR